MEKAQKAGIFVALVAVLTVLGRSWVKAGKFAEKNESMELWSPYWKKLHQLCFKYNDGTFTGTKDPLASLIDAIFGGI